MTSEVDHMPDIERTYVDQLQDDVREANEVAAGYAAEVERLREALTWCRTEARQMGYDKILRITNRALDKDR